MQVKISFNNNWNTVVDEVWTDKGLLELITDIDRRSKVLAPRDTGALINSAKITSVRNGYDLTYGSGRVPYARRRFYENKKHPQTKYYLTNAADSATGGDIGKYFRGKI